MSNAADEKLVKELVDRDRATRENELLDLVDVLKTPQGRRLLWRIMAWCGNEGTPKRATDELTYMAIGSGDVGRWLKSEVVEAGEELLFQMMRENMETNGGKDARRKN